MTRLSPYVIAGVRRLFRLPSRSDAQIAEDVDAELSFHLEARARELVTTGLSPEAAQERAWREFGDVEGARRAISSADVRHERRVRARAASLEIGQDLRFGVRSLARAPGFAAIASLTMAIGIGASTAIFSVVDGVLLRPLPYRDAARTMTIWQQSRASGVREELAPGNFVDLHDRARSFSILAAADPFTMSYQTLDGPESVRTWLVTEGFFDALQVPPRLGRALRADDFRPEGARAVVLSDGAWKRRFGADAAIVGRAVTLDGMPYTVAGVMPPEFQFPGGRELWVPKVISPDERQRRGSGYWLVIGKLKPEATVARARAEAGAIARQLAAEYPTTNRDVDLVLVPLPDQLLGSKRPALLLLLGAAGLLLLVACANVANLALARALSRGRELGIRAALGAGRGRIVRLLAAEAALLATLGGAAGVVLAWGAVRALRLLSPADLPRASEIGIDSRVLAFALLASSATAVLAGLLPALGAARGNLHDRLKDGGRATTLGGKGRRTRSALVVTEVALSLVLLIGAGLLVRSFIALTRADRGFRSDNVLAVTVQAWQWYPAPAQRAAYVRETVDRLAHLPGVHAAGVTSSLPLAEGIGQDEAAYTVEDQAPRRIEEARTAHVTIATPGYFDALGLVVRQGRGFTDSDDSRGIPVALVTAALARESFPGRDAIGRRITVGLGRVAPPIAREIVGVVGDVRQTGLAADPGPAIFLPHAQAPTGALTFTVRTTADPALLLDRVKAELWTVNRAMPIASTTTLDALLAETLRERQFLLVLLVTFGTVALLLAGVGVYGVLGHAVRERRQEFGVRLALGASATQVMALVLLQGARLAVAGVVVGILLAVGGSRLLSAMLYRVAPLDAATFAAITLLVLVAAALAAFVPGRRAAKLDPLAALRDD